ncbi:hypothetical protein BDZ88DRAFT_406048 [Geranomyces variabilis]|nr:hypothetical protein BDZ88DRAFT_406048 [Geranomyces variabilis]
MTVVAQQRVTAESDVLCAACVTVCASYFLCACGCAVGAVPFCASISVSRARARSQKESSSQSYRDDHSFCCCCCCCFLCAVGWARPKKTKADVGWDVVGQRAHTHTVTVPTPSYFARSFFALAVITHFPQWPNQHNMHPPTRGVSARSPLGMDMDMDSGPCEP